MIVVRRGPEPDALRRERWWRQARAMLLCEVGRVDLIGTAGYSVAGLRTSLYDAQHRKCAYCELAHRHGNGHIEHFRPRARYPWLSWTFENLLFGCAACNVEYKGEEFPLREGAAPLTPSLRALPDVMTEDALLVDPARQQPDNFIRFERSRSSGRWLPIPKGDLSPEDLEIAKETIALFKLDEDQGLLDEYEALVERLRERCDQFQETHGSQNSAARHREWELLAEYVKPSKPLAALAWSYIDLRFPGDDYPNLALPHPDDARGDDPAPTDYKERPAEIDAQTWWFVRAAYSSSEADVWLRAAIIALCTTPRSAEALATLLCIMKDGGDAPRARTTIQTHARALIRAEAPWLMVEPGTKPHEYRTVEGETALAYLRQCYTTTHEEECDGYRDRAQVSGEG